MGAEWQEKIIITEGSLDAEGLREKGAGKSLRHLLSTVYMSLQGRVSKPGESSPGNPSRTGLVGSIAIMVFFQLGFIKMLQEFSKQFGLNFILFFF